MSIALPAEEVIAEADVDPDDRVWQRRWQKIEDRLVAAVEWLNPILVKETRQALKSRQFVITFLIVLIACWIVSFGGVVIIGPQIRYAAAGGEMLIAYYAILAFPLTIIVPFTAFRSLASEQEDNTYDLLSITTLTSKQIIAGKLCSAIVQMLVYFCAVSPCLAFTFLLRGVEVATVALLLALTVLGSLGLSMIALLVGTMTKVRYTQVIVSVVLVLGLAWAFAGAVTMALGFHLESHLFIRETEFWVGLAAGLTLFVTTFGLLFAAAAAQIAFASENRATPVRRWMLAQQACFLGWLSVPIAQYPDDRHITPAMGLVGGIGGIAYWYIMGTLMTGEWPHLSRRVQRSLPDSTFGRIFLTWFNPGPATGYLFTVTNLGVLVSVGIVVVLTMTPPGGRGLVDMVVYLLIFGWSYVTAFLGFGRLIINFARRFAFVPMSGAILIQLILVLIGVGIPPLIQMTSRSFGSGRGYTLLHALNPIRTLYELVDHGPSTVYADVLVMILPAVAIIAVLLNLRSVVTELQRQRVAAPSRLIEEEVMLHPAPAVKPTNPWDANEP